MLEAFSKHSVYVSLNFVASLVTALSDHERGVSRVECGRLITRGGCRVECGRLVTRGGCQEWRVGGWSREGDVKSGVWEVSSCGAIAKRLKGW